jgi:hypothetical protein
MAIALSIAEQFNNMIRNVYDVKRYEPTSINTTYKTIKTRELEAKPLWEKKIKHVLLRKHTCHVTIQ